jgi:peroxiredoxin
MKNIIYLFVLVVFMVACNSEPHYTVKGKIDGADSVTFLIQKREAGKTVTIDSVFSKNGSFKMSGSVEYPDLVQLVAKEPRYRISFYLENARINITGKLDSLYNADIAGSKTHDEYKSYIESNKVLSERYSVIYQDYQIARQTNDTSKISSIEKEAQNLQTEMTQLQKDFVKNNPSSYVSPSILRNLSYEMEAEEIEAAIKTMDTNVANTPVVKDLMVRIAAMKAVSIGQKAPDFTLNDVEGNPVSLYAKVGSKLLLVDFWAAWCGPCRQENPNVVKVYSQFHKKGFDIFGVSLDQKKEDWVKAIADDKLTWTHVSDLQYWSSAAAKLYAVNAIPANFLLDETGTIIARNLRGQDLTNKVSEILGK